MDNTPAFPTKKSMQTGPSEWRHEGMMLRDYFAEKAMQGVFTNPIESSQEGKEYIAMHSYKMADAMMAARGQQ